MKLDLQAINQTDFVVSDRGDFYLIVPHESKHVWQPDELHLRSLLCRKDGEIVSSGFGKFFNYGEYTPHTELLNQHLREDLPVSFTTKLDGSLVIRDVIDGKVHFRTRGHHELGEFEPYVMRVVNDRYPKLLNPDFVIRHSVLMEFVSPEKRVVLHYEKPDLTLIGIMRHREDYLPELEADPTELRLIAKFFGMPWVETHELSTEPDELLATIRGWKDCEGVVVRFWTGKRWCLLKIKSEQYLALHSMKFQMTDAKISQIIWRHRAECMDDYGRAMHSLGLDHEVMSCFEPVAAGAIERLHGLRRQTLDIQDAIEKLGPSGKSRKEQVDIIRQVIGDDRSLFNLGIAVLDGKVEEWTGCAFLGMSGPQYRQWLGNE